MDRKYKVGFRGYVADGGDGYHLLKKLPYVSEVLFKQKFLMMHLLIEMDEKFMEGFTMREKINII